MLIQRAMTGLVIATLVGASFAYHADADETVTQDVTIIVAEAGTFSVLIQADGGIDSGFGTISLNAVTDVTTSETFSLEYTDTFTERGAGIVSIYVGSFAPAAPVDPFIGSDQVIFQIPDRYITLSEVGDVVRDAATPACEVGEIVAATFDEGKAFDHGQRLSIATVAEGCGVGSARQAVLLSITIPAGVYPTTYTATVTIETTVEPMG